VKKEGQTKDIRPKPPTTLKPTYKLWLETEEGYVFGRGTLELLEEIQRTGTLSGAAKALRMSYRHAWGVIKRTEERLGQSVLKTRKGGSLGGGGAELTKAGRTLIEAYVRHRIVFDQIGLDELSWEGLSMKISARNRMEGEVVSVEKDKVSAIVRLRIRAPCIVTAFITREAVESLGIRKGDRAIAVVKATEVMISKE